VSILVEFGPSAGKTWCSRMPPKFCRTEAALAHSDLPAAVKEAFVGEILKRCC